MKTLEYNIVLAGIGAESNRGAVGWCAVTLISSGGKLILFDTGSNDDREELLTGLKELGIEASDIDIVFISHLHYDHCCNIELFESADIMVSKREFDYVMTGEFKAYDDYYVPWSLIDYFSKDIKTVNENDEIAPGVKVVSLAGHTPGSSGLLLEDDILLAGDAVKNAWDFTHNIPPKAIFSREKGLENYSKILELARLIIPGHGRPFKVNGTSVEYVGENKHTYVRFFPNADELMTLEKRAYEEIWIE